MSGISCADRGATIFDHRYAVTAGSTRLLVPLAPSLDRGKLSAMTEEGLNRRHALVSIIGTTTSLATPNSSAIAGSFRPIGRLAIYKAGDLEGLLRETTPHAVGTLIRTSEGYLYEVVENIHKFDEIKMPRGYHLFTKGGIKLKLFNTKMITPEMLGGDLHMAAAYAAVFKVTLMTGPVDYEITTPFTPHDITWVSKNTRIKQISTLGGVSVMRPQNNVKHIGRTYLHLPYAESGSANRGFIVFGNWETGVGFENFHFDEFVFEGGHPNCNGLAIVGDAHNVRGRRLDAGVSTTIGRVFMAHWGNFASHFNDGNGTYRHSSSATPTTHPHDIVIDEVVGDLKLSVGDFCALWCVSAGYDIHVGRVTGRCVNNGGGPGELILLTAGDLGFAYATPAQRTAGMWGLTAGDVSGSCSHTGVRRIGLPLYYNADSTPQPAENYFAKIQEAVGTVDVYNTIGNNAYCCVDGHNGHGSSKYGRVLSRNFRSAVACSNYTQDMVIDNIEAINNHNQAIQLAGYGDTEANWPTRIQIGTLRVDGTGIAETTASASTVSNIRKINVLSIGTIIVDKLKDMEIFSSASLQIGADVRNITIDNVVLNWVGNGQTAAIINAAARDRGVKIGQVRGLGSLLPLKRL